jgi:hemoglobin
MSEEQETTTLFEQLGGAAAVEAAVDIFYRKVLEDYRVYRFFDNSNMEEQVTKQKAFLTMAFGGPNDYQGKDLRTAHAKLVKLGLSDSHFNIIIEHLTATLAELSVPPALISQVIALAESTRTDVLGR